VFVLLALVGGFCGPAGAGEPSFSVVLDKRAARFWLAPDGAVFAAVDRGWMLAPQEGGPSGYVLYRSGDGGRTWSELEWFLDGVRPDPKDVAAIYDLAFLSDGSAFMAGRLSSAGEFLARSADGGRHWKRVQSKSGVPAVLEGAGGSLLGVFGTTVKVSGNGEYWSDCVSGATGQDGGLAAAGGDAWIAVLRRGAVAATLDGGQTWRTADIGLAAWPGGPGVPWEPRDMTWGRAACAADPGGGWTAAACGPGMPGGVFVSRDLERWERADRAQFAWRPGYGPSRPVCVAAAPGGLVFAGTADGCVMASGDYGRTWKPLARGLLGEVTQMACVPAGESVAVFALTGGRLARVDVPRAFLAGGAAPPGGATGGAPTVRFVVGRTSYFVGDRAFETDAAPFIENGRTFVPVRYLAYALGVPESGVAWDPAAQAVTLVRGGTVVRLAIGSRTLAVDGRTVEMDVAPVLRGGRTYLPARFVAEAFGFRVGWESETQTVVISE
jgi:hypothetical protein